MSSKTFCILPFIHIEARSDSYVAPCCMSQEFFKKDDGTFFTLCKDSLSDVWESTAMQTLRTALLNGEKPSACSACWREEAYGKESKRIRENARWGTEVPEITTPKFLDLKLGNSCNLKCRVCSPGSSSFWIKEHKDIYGHDVVSDIGKTISIHTDKRMVMQWPDYNEKFWDDINEWLPTVELFEIYGGEPFLIKKHFNLLKKSIELGYSKNQRVHYNSNGTIFPKDAVENIWPHFKDVDVMFSIDGIGEQFEYQRHPAKWDEVEHNLELFMASSCRTEVCMTVSAMNVYYLPEYLDYFKAKGISVWLNILYTPDYFSIQNLPTHVKELVQAKLTVSEHTALEPVINFMMGKGNNMLPELIDRLNKHDAYRNEKYSITFPEFAKILNE